MKLPLCALALLGLSIASNASAVEIGGKVNEVENGWLGEGLALQLSGSGVTGCPSPPYQFAIDKSHPAYKDMVAIALAAFASGSEVVLVVEPGVCLFGDRTKVVAIRLKRTAS